MIKSASRPCLLMLMACLFLAGCQSAQKTVQIDRTPQSLAEKVALTNGNDEGGGAVTAALDETSGAEAGLSDSQATPASETRAQKWSNWPKNPLSHFIPRTNTLTSETDEGEIAGREAF
ncbi:MAG: hypothetical protein R3C11_16580 [Planctomycetaceae bacterium]